MKTNAVSRVHIGLVVGKVLVGLAMTVLLGEVAYASIPVRAAETSDERTLYVQEGCSHCANVEAFLEENNLLDAVVIKDIAADTGASEEFTERLDALDVPLNDRGVPLLMYGDEQWLSGDDPIIDYFREEFDIPEEKEPMKAGDYALLIGGTVALMAVLGYGIVNARNGSKSN